MKTNSIVAALVFSLFLPMGAFAINMPVPKVVPEQIDADTYTFVFQVENGATVSVVGGPADIAPVRDGEGNPLDGLVEVTVGLAQNQKNVFSVLAIVGEKRSDTQIFTIEEKPKTVEKVIPEKGDTVPPAKPVLDEYPASVETVSLTLTGSTEANANINARRPDGRSAGSTQADSHGVFRLRVNLFRGQTNRIRVSAEDAAGNEGEAAEAVITVSRNIVNTVEREAPVVTAPPAARFADTRGHWAEAFIDKLAEEGVVQGKSETEFDPNEKISRAELTKMALKAFKYEVKTAVAEEFYKDVPKDAWFAPFVEAAKEAGIVDWQRKDQLFQPNRFIDRASALKILFEASRLPQIKESEKGFKDVPAAAWFYRYVISAAAYDIVSGYADGSFRPDAYITRAEVTKILVKMMELTGN